MLSSSSSVSGRRSVARRVTAIGIAMVALVLLALSLVTASITNQASRTQLVASVGHATQALVASIDTVEQANRDMVLKASEGFARHFAGSVALDSTSGQLSVNGEVLNGNFGVVDKFSADTGGVATVFARQGDDFVRISTSLRNLQGERVMGTRLDRQHAAYARLRDGQTFIGRANLFGKPYMTHYAPLRDAQGQVVGILFVGTDLSAFQQGLLRQVADLRLYEHGGAMVIDPGASLEQARFVAHPSHAGQLAGHGGQHRRLGARHRGPAAAAGRRPLGRGAQNPVWLVGGDRSVRPRSHGRPAPRAVCGVGCHGGGAGAAGRRSVLGAAPGREPAAA